MRTGKYQKGQFNVMSGMAFVMPDLDEVLPDGQSYEAGRHPWIITRVDDYYVEMVMCSTLSNNHENKHRMNVLLEKPNVSDISKTCPPMDPPNECMSCMSMDKFKIFPKVQLFSHDLRLLNNNTVDRNFKTEGMESLCIDSDELKFIRKELLKYSVDIPEFKMDPFGYFEAEDCWCGIQEGEPVLDNFTEESFMERFDWTHIKQADPLAIYPTEDKLNEFEKEDKKLIAKIHYRDNRLELTEEDLKNLELPEGYERK